MNFNTQTTTLNIPTMLDKQITQSIYNINLQKYSCKKWKN